MSEPSRTRIVEDPAYWEPVVFTNINEQWLKKYPNDRTRDCSVLTTSTRRLFEAITPNSTKDHKTWKKFEHYKAEQNYAHGTSSRGVRVAADLGAGSGALSIADIHSDKFFNRSTEYGPPGQYNLGLTAWYVPRADGGFIPEPTDLELLKQRSLKAMLPQIKNELSSLVSLYEIKDLLSIRGTLAGLTKVGKQLFNKIVGGGSKPIGRAVVREGAGAYLQGMFNIRPLISDIYGIYRVLTTYERRINDFVSRSGKIQTAHFMCNLKEQLGGRHEPYGPYRPATGHPLGVILMNGGPRYCMSNVALQRSTFTDSAVFRACMQYNYSLSAYQREHAKVLGLLDMLGVNFNPSYLWNVLPWSFVVDWVFGVSQWLDQFEVKNMEPKVNILQYCWSVKKTRRVRVTGAVRTSYSYSSPGFYSTQYLTFPEVVETSYRRGIDLPSSSSFTTSGLSPTELSLGAALILSRRRRKTKRS